MLVAVGSVVGEDVSSCCYRLTINSSEEATEHQGNRLGEYRSGGRRWGEKGESLQYIRCRGQNQSAIMIC
jgi:hypothetical protein